MSITTTNNNEVGFLMLANNRYLSKIKSEEEIVKNFNETKKERIQNRIFDYYEKNLEEKRLQEYNINKERIYNFLNKYNLKVPRNILFLKKEDFNIIQTVYEEFGINNKFFDYQKENIGGFFEIRSEIVYIILDDEEQDSSILEGSLTKESIAIHELIHFNRGYNYLHIEKGRHGFISKDNKGLFYEEGIAEYIEKEYFQQHSQYGENTKNILLNNPVQLFEKIDVDSGWFRLHIDNNTITFSKFAGLGLELLFKEKPELLDIMLLARKSDSKDGKPLQDIAKIINSFKLPDIIQDGKITKRSLYKELRNLKYDKKEFLYGFELIKEAIVYTKSLENN